MKRVSYAEQTFGTDERVAELVLEYAQLLARDGASDTVSVPGRIGDGAVEAVSLLIGPASQITAWDEGEPFDGDAREAVADLERRIRGRTGVIEASAEDPGPGLGDFDELG